MEGSHADSASRTCSGPAPILAPVLALFALTALIRWADLDRSIQQLFWSPLSGWTFESSAFVDFLYHYGTWPAVFAATIGFFAWIYAAWTHRAVAVGKLGGFLVVALLLGPGLIVNYALKDHYGRPRPRDVIEFSGREYFRPIGEPTFSGHGKSFPSGHSAMGFFWFAPCIYLWRQRRRVAMGFGILALCHGALMGLARTAQGAHWMSDHLWAAGVLYITYWVLHALSPKVPFVVPNLGFRTSERWLGASISQTQSSPMT